MIVRGEQWREGSGGAGEKGGRAVDLLPLGGMVPNTGCEAAADRMGKGAAAVVAAARSAAVVSGGGSGPSVA